MSLEQSIHRLALAIEQSNDLIRIALKDEIALPFAPEAVAPVTQNNDDATSVARESCEDKQLTIPLNETNETAPKRTRPSRAKPKPEAQAPEVAGAEAPVVAEAPKDETVYTLADIREVSLRVRDKVSLEAAKGMLVKFHVGRISDINPIAYPEYVAHAKSLLEAA